MRERGVVMCEGPQGSEVIVCVVWLLQLKMIHAQAQAYLLPTWGHEDYYMYII